MHIPVFRPLLGPSEFKAVHDAIENGWLGMGSYVGEFEKTVESLVGRDGVHAVALSTGHAALHLALMDLNVTFGDEVITASFNNIADFQAIMAVGAKPVFCDIDEQTLCIDVKKVEELISPRTKAIIIMDYGCHLCDYDAFLQLRKRTGIPIIHDAAHSFGGLDNGKCIGGIFDYTMFSFDPVKNVTCIDGGMLLVHDKDTVMRLRERRLVGMGQPSEVMYQNKRAWTYDVKYLGFRYHMANLHAKIGLAQLGQLDKIRQSRIEVFSNYSTAFMNLKNFKIPQLKSVRGFVALPFLFYLRVMNGKREAFIKFMQERGVDIGIHWQPGHTFSLFKDSVSGDLTVTNIIKDEIVSIPFHSAMDHNDQNSVIQSVIAFDQL